MHALGEELLRQKVLVILRGVKPEEVVAVCEVIACCGGRFLEIPLNSPRALESIKIAAAHFRGTGVHIGAGTVLDAQAVESVTRAGASFILSPNTDAAVLAKARENGLLPIPGFMTPTEAFLALRAGAEILKCFPYGSPSNLAVLKSVIPNPLFAVGGIDVGNFKEVLSVADGVGVGAGLFRPGMSLDEISERARMFFGAQHAKAELAVKIN